MAVNVLQHHRTVHSALVSQLHGILTSYKLKNSPDRKTNLHACIYTIYFIGKDSIFLSTEPTSRTLPFQPSKNFASAQCPHRAVKLRALVAVPQPTLPCLPSHVSLNSRVDLKFLPRVHFFPEYEHFKAHTIIFYLTLKLAPVFPKIFWLQIILSVNKLIRNIENARLPFSFLLPRE